MKTQFDGFGTNFDPGANKMTSGHSPVNAWPVRAALGLSLALGLMLGNAAPLVSAATTTSAQAAWPVRNFLPPIASINPRLNEKTVQPVEGDLNPIALSAVSSPVLHTTPKVGRLDSNIDIVGKNEQIQTLADIQKKVDEADLESLWQATVEKNPVIRFSLEKLATPADLQQKQSSKFLSKSLNLLISGATMGATMLPGASAYRNMGAMSVGNALQNLANGNTKPAPNTLSATEQIQLAGLIDELKLKLIHNYQDYKNTLQALAEAREITMRNNNLYSKALGSRSDLGVMAAGSAYYSSLMQETTLRQKAKLYRLQLERIAGTDAVARLELAPHVSLDGKAASDGTEIGPAPELKTSATVLPGLPASKPAPKTTSLSSTDTTTLPQAMEIGPSLHPDNDLIGPPLPALSSNVSHNVKSKRAAVRNYSDKNALHGQPQPIPDKIMEHPASLSQEKP